MGNPKDNIRRAKQLIADSVHKISDDEVYIGFIGRGDANKTVLVPHKPGYVYIRIPKQINSGELTEYSEHIAISKNEYRHNAPVKVVKRRDNPSQFEVKELWIAGMGIASAESLMGSVTNHHWNHELYTRSGGHDPVMIDEAQIKNMQITPTSPPSSKVIIGSGWYLWKDRTVHWYDGTTLELASDVPSGTNAETYVNVWLNPTDDSIHKEIRETINIPGFGVDKTQLVIWPDEDYIPLGCVRLEADVYQIDWSRGKTPNIINMRSYHSMMPGDMLPAIHPLNPPEGYHSGSLDSVYVRETDPSGTYQYDNLHDILELELGPERARVKVSSDDTTPDYLENKVVSAGGVSIGVLNPGANEKLELFVSGTGGAGTPADSVTSEITYNQASSAGVSTDYSRGDHTHGTPDHDSHANLSGVTSDQHHARSHNHSNASDGSTLSPSTLNIPSASTPSQTAEGQMVWDNDDDIITVGDGTSRKQFGKLGTTSPATLGTATPGTSLETSHADHVHAHGTGTVANAHAHADLSGVTSDQHHARSHDHSNASDGSTLTPAILDIPSSATPSQTAEGRAVWDSDGDELTIGTGASRKVLANNNLGNLVSTAVNTDIIPDSNNARALGSAANKWSLAALITALFDEGSAPSTPASGDLYVYVSADHILRLLSSLGQDSGVAHGEYNTGAVSFSNDAGVKTIISRVIKANAQGTVGWVHTGAIILFQNNTGGNRTITPVYNYGAYSKSFGNQLLASSATNRMLIMVDCWTMNDQANNVQFHALQLKLVTMVAGTQTSTPLYTEWNTSSIDTSADVTVSITAQMSGTGASCAFKANALQDGPYI